MVNNLMNTSLWTVLAIIVIGFLVAVIVAAIALFFIVRRLQRISEPDIAEMQARLEDLRRKNPKLNDEALLRKIIGQESLKCGIIGAVTGLGGFITLPIALPLDVLLSMRVQSKLVQFIALTYGHQAVSETELKIQSYLVMTGGARASEAAFDVVMKFVLRIIGESFAKIIPVIGALVSFVVSYGIAQATGNVALRWYASRYPQLPGQQQQMLNVG